MKYDKYRLRVIQFNKFLNVLFRLRFVFIGVAVLGVGTFVTLSLLKGNVTESFEFNETYSYGESFTPVGKATMNAVNYEYKLVGSDEWVSELPREVGDYVARPYSYNGFGVKTTGEEKSFTILPKSVDVNIMESAIIYGDSLSANIVGLANDDKISNVEFKYGEEYYDVNPFSDSMSFTTKVDINQETFKISDDQGNDHTKNYAFNFISRDVSISKRRLEVTTPSVTRSYNASVLEAQEVTIKEGTLVEGDELKASNFASITNIGTSLNSADIKITDGEHDRTAFYALHTAFGTLEVTSIKLDLSSSTVETREYDGEGLTTEDLYPIYNKDLLLEGHSLVVTFDHIDEVITNGTVDNTYTYSIVDKDNNDVSLYYDVTESSGTINITKRHISYQTVGGSKYYDGTPITKQFVINGTPASGDSFKEVELVSLTNPGTLNGQYEFVIISSRFEDNQYDDYYVVENNTTNPAITVNGLSIDIDGYKMNDRYYNGKTIQESEITQPVITGNLEQLETLGYKVVTTLNPEIYEQKVGHIDLTYLYKIVDSNNEEISHDEYEKINITTHKYEADINKIELSIYGYEFKNDGRSYNGKYVSDEEIAKAYVTGDTNGYKVVTYLNEDIYEVFVGTVPLNYTYKIFDADNNEVSALDLIEGFVITNIPHADGNIIKRTITSIKYQDSEVTYDGNEHSAEVTPAASGLYSGDSIALKSGSFAKGTNIDSYNSDFTIYISNPILGDVSSAYNIPLFDTPTLTIKPIDITITSNSINREYDGKEVSKDAEDEADKLSISYDSNLLLNGHKVEYSFGYEGKDITSGEQSNSFTYRMATLNGSDALDGNGTPIYNVSTEYGVINITKRNITVTTNNIEGEYSGHKISKDSEYAPYILSYTLDGSLASGDLVTDATYAAEGQFIYYGNNDVVITIGDNTSKYNISYKYGTIDVHKRYLKIDVTTKEFTYDGYAHSSKAYAFLGSKADTDVIKQVGEQTFTNVGVYENPFTFSVYNNLYDFDATSYYYSDSVTTNFEKDVKGSLTINKRNLTVNLFIGFGDDYQDNSIYYDGLNHQLTKENNFFIDSGTSLADKQVIYSVKNSGDDIFAQQRINAGKYSYNNIEITIVDEDDSSKQYESNYDIKLHVFGAMYASDLMVEILPRTLDLQINIDKGETYYDGEDHPFTLDDVKVIGGSYAINQQLYSIHNDSSGSVITSSQSRVDAGKYYYNIDTMVIVDQFSNAIDLDNYDISITYIGKTDSTGHFFEILKRPITFTIRAGDGSDDDYDIEATYDGESEHIFSYANNIKLTTSEDGEPLVSGTTVSSYAINFEFTPYGEQYPTSSPLVYNSNPELIRKNAGLYHIINAEFNISDASNYRVTVTYVDDNRDFTINPCVLEFTTNDLNRTYNGNTYGSELEAHVSDNPFYADDDLTFNFTYASNYKVTTSELTNTLSSIVVKENSHEIMSDSNFACTYHYGKINIAKKQLDIKYLGYNGVYDGEYHEVKEYELLNGTALATTDHFALLHDDTYYSPIVVDKVVTEYDIYRNTEKVTDCYSMNIAREGVTITKRPVSIYLDNTISGASIPDKEMYKGAYINCNTEFVITGLAANDRHDGYMFYYSYPYYVSGDSNIFNYSVINAGEYTFNSDQFKFTIRNTNNTNVTDYYDITFTAKYQKWTIEKAPLVVSIDFSLNGSKSVVYDATRYELDLSDKIQTVNDTSLKGMDYIETIKLTDNTIYSSSGLVATRVNAGKYYYDIIDVTINDGNNDVTSNYVIQYYYDSSKYLSDTDGRHYVEITKRPLDVELWVGFGSEDNTTKIFDSDKSDLSGNPHSYLNGTSLAYTGVYFHYITALYKDNKQTYITGENRVLVGKYYYDDLSYEIYEFNYDSDENIDVTDNYKQNIVLHNVLTEGSGDDTRHYVEILPRDITLEVDIGFNDEASVVYDGNRTTFGIDRVREVGTTYLANYGHSIETLIKNSQTTKDRVDGTYRHDVGKYYYDDLSVEIYSANPILMGHVQNNYNITYIYKNALTEGSGDDTRHYSEITKRPITVEVDVGIEGEASYIYDGVNHSFYGIDHLNITGGLGNTDYIVNLNIPNSSNIQSRLNVGKYYYDGLSLQIASNYSSNEQDNYDITFTYKNALTEGEGVNLKHYVEITKRPITVTTNTIYRDYDGKDYELSVDVDNLASGHELSYTLTYAGKYEVTQTPLDNNFKTGPTVIYKTNTSTTNVTSNYDITVVAGTITVNKKDITLTCASGEYAYGDSLDDAFGYLLSDSDQQDRLSVIYSSHITTNNPVVDEYVNEYTDIVFRDPSRLNAVVTQYFNITVIPGEIIINPREIYFDVYQDYEFISKAFDGDPISDEYPADQCFDVIGDFVSGDTVEYSYDHTIEQLTNVTDGIVELKHKATVTRAINKVDTDISYCYKFTWDYCTYKITNSTVTFKTKSGEPIEWDTKATELLTEQDIIANVFDKNYISNYIAIDAAPGYEVTYEIYLDKYDVGRHDIMFRNIVVKFNNEDVTEDVIIEYDSSLVLKINKILLSFRKSLDVDQETGKRTYSIPVNTTDSFVQTLFGTTTTVLGHTITSSYTLPLNTELVVEDPMDLIDIVDSKNVSQKSLYRFSDYLSENPFSIIEEAVKVNNVYIATSKTFDDQTVSGDTSFMNGVKIGNVIYSGITDAINNAAYSTSYTTEVSFGGNYQGQKDVGVYSKIISVKVMKGVDNCSKLFDLSPIGFTYDKESDTHVYNGTFAINKCNITINKVNDLTYTYDGKTHNINTSITRSSQNKKSECITVSGTLPYNYSITINYSDNIVNAGSYDTYVDVYVVYNGSYYDLMSDGSVYDDGNLRVSINDNSNSFHTTINRRPVLIEMVGGLQYVDKDDPTPAETYLNLSVGDGYLALVSGDVVYIGNEKLDKNKTNYKALNEITEEGWYTIIDFGLESAVRVVRTTGNVDMTNNYEFMFRMKDDPNYGQNLVIEYA